jgi:hypothetical protein
LKLLSHDKKDQYDNTYPWDCYVGTPKPEEYGRGESVYMMLKKTGILKIKLDAELIKRNDLQKIMIKPTFYNNIKAVVFNREFDGSIIDYFR